MPDLTAGESVELTAIRSLAGVLDPALGLVSRPPFSAPHHDASRTSVVGGGNGRVRPGLISLAHGGVLFMDEFPLFRTDVIEALREPLENGDITVARGEEAVTLPARSMVVLAANPCACGNQIVGKRADCTCTPVQRRDYDLRMRGPIADRIDVVRHLSAALFTHDPLGHQESSATIRARVASARARQTIRYADHDWRLNSQAPSAALRERWPMTHEAQLLVDKAIGDGRLSRRGAVKVHRLAWTVADLREEEIPGEYEAGIALALRQGDALPTAAVSERAG